MLTIYCSCFLLSDFQTLFDKVHNDTKGLEGRKLRLERVPVCTSILVTGLRDDSTDDTIQVYFENEKRSGGSDVSKVERIWKDKAVVSFEDSSSKETLRENKTRTVPFIRPRPFNLFISIFFIFFYTCPA